MEFKNKQFDGPYEVSGIDIYNDGELFKGLLYFPPKPYEKPYPLIIYFHGFPQLFTLQEIIREHEYLLEKGYAFISFNFRGYGFSDGQISIKSQVSDSLKIIEFVEIMANNKIFDLNSINIISHDFGAYIALILCSKIKLVNKLLLKSPILDLKKHIYSDNFLKTLYYINRFLPGHIKGIEHVEEFVKETKIEIIKEEYQIEKFIKTLKCKKLKIIGGEIDKVTPVSEIKDIIGRANVNTEINIINRMDHECTEDEEVEKINKEITKFFEK